MARLQGPTISRRSVIKGGAAAAGGLALTSFGIIGRAQAAKELRIMMAGGSWKDS